MCSSDSMRYVSMASWFITGAISLSIGLNALGIDVQALLHLQNMEKGIQYIAGLCGAYSLVMLFMSCCESCNSCK